MTSQDPGSFSRDSGLPLPGSTLGGYVVQRQIGQGGMAAVFEATHQSLGKRVALKMLLPHHAARSSVARRFMREGEAAAAINHPNAVDVTDVGTDLRGAPYLVMEFLDGEDLGALLERHPRLSVEDTADILVPVLSALAAAHDLGIVHRDLKPSNIFLARRRQELVPKVVDFGISKVEADSAKLTGTQALLGTPHYMSPEQAQGASMVDARSDQFALGVILYECVTGKRPFDGVSLWGVLAQIIHGAPTPPSKVAEGLPPEFEALIERTLRKSPDQRFPDVRALGAALIKFAGVRTRMSYASDFGVSADLTSSSDRRSQAAWRPSAVDHMAHANAATVAEERAPTLSGKKVALWKPALAAGVVAVGVIGALARLPSEAPRKPPPQPVVAPLPRIEPPVEREPPAVAEPAAEPVRYDVKVTVKPATAALKLDGQSAGTGTLVRSFVADGSEHVVEATAPGHRAQSVRFRDRAPAGTLTLEKIVARAQPAAAVTQPVARPAAPEPEPSRPSEPAKGNYGTNGAAILR